MSRTSTRGRLGLVAAAASLGLAAPLVGAASAAVPPPGAVDTKAKACPTAKVPSAGFTDIAGNTFTNEINCIGDYGITRGTTDTTFSPSKVVLRQQMVVFIFNALAYSGKEPVNYTDAGFTDLGGLTQGQRNIVNAMANAGVVKGFTATTFGPTAGVTRAQMASFIDRSQTLVDTGFTSVLDYYDDDSTSVHQKAINDITAAGLATGVGNGNYNPRGMTTRAQMAGFLARFVAVNINRTNIGSVYL